MRAIVILTLAASLCFATGAQARKAHSHRQHASGASHVSHGAQTARAPAGHMSRRGGGNDPAAFDDTKTPAAGEWTPDTSFGGGKAARQASDGFGMASGGHNKRGQTDLGYSTKPRRQRTS